MSLFRYALLDYRAAVGMLRGYFGAIRDFGEHAVAEPGDMLPVCVLVGAVPRLIAARWSRPGTTIHARQRAGRMVAGATALAVARSRIYGPLYHRRQR
ncbi:MAG TPA: hypothetical protein VNT02_16135, partial [Burkholderiales bacterium]|nr:hypothetical protein [Burkholderiales bacterium]